MSHHPEPLRSRKNPRVQRVVRLRDRRDREREGAFLIEGYRELRRATDRHLPIEELFVCPELFLGENEPALIADAENHCGARVSPVTAPVFERMAYRDRPEGLLAVAPTPDWRLDQLAGRPPHLYVVASQIEKPGNLGTILRSADAAGASAVIVCDRCTDLFNPNVVRASIGSLFTVPVAETTTEELLPWLRRQGARTLATSPDARQVYTDVDLTASVAIILGSEQYGLDERWLRETDVSVRIPMAGEADSLNVAMAATVVLFEAARQRWVSALPR